MKKLEEKEIKNLKTALQKCQTKEELQIFAEDLLIFLEENNTIKDRIKKALSSIKTNIIKFTDIREQHLKVINTFNIQVENFNKIVRAKNNSIADTNPIDLNDTAMVDKFLKDLNEAEEQLNTELSMIDKYILGEDLT